MREEGEAGFGLHLKAPPPLGSGLLLGEGDTQGEGSVRSQKKSGRKKSRKFLGNILNFSRTQKCREEVTTLGTMLLGLSGGTPRCDGRGMLWQRWARERTSRA